MAPVSEDPRSVVDAYIAGLEGETRQVAFAEWGITVDAAGWPLHVGVAIRDGVLRAQAQVIEAERIDPHDLLRWNRQIPFMRFAHTRDGEVWIQGDLPLSAVPPPSSTASSACSCSARRRRAKLRRRPRPPPGVISLSSQVAAARRRRARVRAQPRRRRVQRRVLRQQHSRSPASRVTMSVTPLASSVAAWTAS